MGSNGDRSFSMWVLMVPVNGLVRHWEHHVGFVKFRQC